VAKANSSMVRRDEEDISTPTTDKVIGTVQHESIPTSPNKGGSSKISPARLTETTNKRA